MEIVFLLIFLWEEETLEVGWLKSNDKLGIDDRTCKFQYQQEGFKFNELFSRSCKNMNDMGNLGDKCWQHWEGSYDYDREYEVVEYI